MPFVDIFRDEEIARQQRDVHKDSANPIQGLKRDACSVKYGLGVEKLLFDFLELVQTP